MNVAWCWKFSSFDTHFGARNCHVQRILFTCNGQYFYRPTPTKYFSKTVFRPEMGMRGEEYIFRDLLRTIDAIIKHNKNVVPNDSERKTICELLTQEETWTLKKVDFLNLLSSYMSKSVEENLQTTQRPVNEYLTKRSFNRSPSNQEKKYRSKKCDRRFNDRSKRCCFIDHSNSVSVVRKLKF